MWSVDGWKLINADVGYYREQGERGRDEMEEGTGRKERKKNIALSVCLRVFSAACISIKSSHYFM